MDLSKLSASNGTGEAVRALVTSPRSAGSTVLNVNSLVNWPANFVATTGPLLANGIIDPAKALVFVGHITGATITIDSLAPGYVDTYGSQQDDVVVLKPTTWWADTLVDAVSDLKTAVDTDIPLYQSDGNFDYVASGGVWSGDAYASTRNASMTALVCYINGRRGTISAVTARSFTASKDTYIDVLNSSGTFSLVYTEVTNNAASPALAANSIRIGIVVTGASNIANAGSVNQGQENKVLPIASSVPYQVTDSLGNLICPRDPSRKILGYREITSDFTTASSTLVQITGLTVPVIVPFGRKIRLTLFTGSLINNTASNFANMAICNGTVSDANRVSGITHASASSDARSATASKILTLSGGAYTFNAGLKTIVGGVAYFSASPIGGSERGPGHLTVELA